MYPYFPGFYNVCFVIGACTEKKQFFEEPTCDDCIDLLSVMGNIAKSEEKIAEIIDFLKVIPIVCLNSLICSNLLFSIQIQFKPKLFDQNYRKN